LYASDKKNDTPLNNQLPTPPAESSNIETIRKSNPLPILSRGMKRRPEDNENAMLVKRRKLVAQARFGNSALPDDKKGIEKLEIRVEDPFPTIRRTNNEGEAGGEIDEEQNEWSPAITIALNGTHVFAGIRELVECGIIDGEKMPGWLTGEEGVSVGAVKEGRIRDFKGSGI
jgi:central kinetochore subunit Mis15/CHL4